tara:strand:- start:757 stop:930 length:174 start_codon:yes stop_codon:yes gene_type:complete
MGNMSKINNYIAMEKIRFLQDEIEILESRIKPSATGHLHTAISVLNGRVDELVGTLS